MSSERLPWRGPGPDRPDLPLPPGPMPLRRHGQNRKRWRYVGLYGPEAMLCMARAEVGPLGQCFWSLWDRAGDRTFQHTSLRPGSREVRMDGAEVGIETARVRVSVRLGEAESVESICPSGSGWGWTRKRAGVPAGATIEVDGERRQLECLAVDDESAGYQRRDTSWHWSAGVGRAADGRALAWNLVEGINDPPRNSERAVWVEGDPREPAPVRFDGLAAVRFPDGARLSFRAESERARRENFLLLRSEYVHRFGTFAGSLDGIELAEGYGVMERHEAHW